MGQDTVDDGYAPSSSVNDDETLGQDYGLQVAQALRAATSEMETFVKETWPEDMFETAFCAYMLSLLLFTPRLNSDCFLFGFSRAPLVANPSKLQSIGALAHFHVFVRGKREAS
jgi:hypothetical protein